MFLGNSRKKLLVLLSLLISSWVSAAPIAADNSRNFITPTLSASADAYLLGYEINQTNKFYNSPLARVAAELFKPPAITDLSSSNTSVKTLPAVPGTLFMVLAGFLCVSLVNDRRTWLTALAGILWLGQTGFAALPQLASHILSKKHIQQQSSPTLTYVSELDGSYRLRSDIEGTQYIGLLRHLAGIPAREKEPYVKSAKNTADRHRAKYLAPSFRRGFPQYKVTQFAIVRLLSEITLPTNCLVFTARQTVPFSPAFIFSRLARSPPQPA